MLGGQRVRDKGEQWRVGVGRKKGGRHRMNRSGGLVCVCVCVCV